MSVRDICLAALVALVWGANFVSAKFGIQYFPPFLLTALRFCLVGVLLLPFLKWQNKETMKYLLALAITLGTGHFAFLYAAIYHGLSIPTAIIITQLGVPFSCMLGTIFFKDTLGMWRTGGMVLAFMGLIIVVGTPDVTANVTGLAFGIIGGMLWGVANVIMKKMGRVDVFQMVGWMAIFSILPLFTISAVMENWTFDLIRHAPGYAIASVTYTALFSTILAYGLWFSLMSRNDMSQVTPFTLLVPVVGITIGQVFFHENITMQTVLGGILTFIGVTIIVMRRPKNVMHSNNA